jgi:hypothetical protein
MAAMASSHQEDREEEEHSHGDGEITAPFCKLSKIVVIAFSRWLLL